MMITDVLKNFTNTQLDQLLDARDNRQRTPPPLMATPGLIFATLFNHGTPPVPTIEPELEEEAVDVIDMDEASRDASSRTPVIATGDTASIDVALGWDERPEARDNDCQYQRPPKDRSSPYFKSYSSAPSSSCSSALSY